MRRVEHFPAGGLRLTGREPVVANKSLSEQVLCLFSVAGRHVYIEPVRVPHAPHAYPKTDMEQWRGAPGNTKGMENCSRGARGPVQPDGQLRDMVCRSLMLELHRSGPQPIGKSVRFRLYLVSTRPPARLEKTSPSCPPCETEGRPSTALLGPPWQRDRRPPAETPLPGDQPSAPGVTRYTTVTTRLNRLTYSKCLATPSSSTRRRS